MEMLKELKKNLQHRSKRGIYKIKNNYIYIIQIAQFLSRMINKLKNVNKFREIVNLIYLFINFMCNYVTNFGKKEKYNEYRKIKDILKEILFKLKIKSLVFYNDKKEKKK